MLSSKRLRSEVGTQLEESDAKLVQLCLAKDSLAWEQLVRTHARKILNMAYRYTGNNAVAEELTQDIFLKVYQNLSSFSSGRGSFQSWIMSVGRNHIVDYWRAHKREKEEVPLEEPGLPETKSTGIHPFKALYTKEKGELLESALEELPLELKEAVILRDIEELSYQEIVDLVNIPEGTVKSRINRGRIRLAQVLRKRDLNELL